MSASSTSALSASLFQLSWIIEPLSTQRLLWDIVSILFTLNDAITVPLLVFELPDDLALVHTILQFIRVFFFG
jgi:hypothetical protein